MQSITKLYENIIIESVLSDGQLSIIEDAIKNVYRIKINYKAEELGDKNAYYKEVIPIRWGYHKKTGNPMMRAYEQLGATSGRNAHKESKEGKRRFKLFRFDRIISVNPTGGKIFVDPTSLKAFTETDKELNVKLNVDLNKLKEKL